MIDRVEICFEQRENMEGVLILQSVISFDQNGKEIDNYQNMVGEQFFGDDAEQDAIDAVARWLQIPANIIEIVDTDCVQTPWDD